LKDLLVSRIRESLWIFAGAVAFVLLIDCANVANLLLMRAAARQQEIAVRAALGAGRQRLLRQLLTESVLVSITGGAAGLLCALWGVPALLALAPAGRIPRGSDVRVDGAVLAFTFGVSLVTGLLFGLIPALHVTRRQIRDTLTLGARTVSARYGSLRNGLVIAEIALALVLVTGAGLMTKSFLRLRAVDPGFRPQNAITMTVQLPEAVYRTAAGLKGFYQRLLERLSLMPGIAAAGAVSYPPLAGNRIVGDFQAQGVAYPANYLVEKEVVSPGYFQAMGIRLIGGRDFSGRDTEQAPGVAIVSQSVARRLWPGEDAIGKRISERDHPGPGDWRDVVGIVDDVHHAGLAMKANPALYFPYQQSPIRGWLTEMTFVVRTTGDPSAVAPAMRDAVRAVDPNQPLESITTLDALVARNTAEPLFQARLLAVFSLFALALAAIGVYGVLSHAVAARTQEIGIRMALGAERRDVMRLVLRRTLMLATAGVAAGIVGSFAATRVLSKLLFEVKPTDEPTFAAVSLMLVMVALAAGWIPARRATRVDPMVALRYE
jgi:putative ABC transport system permease protein